ncbi:MAG: hypothetical protein SFV15_12410 [Polyangiaceae bacterium]|nr:hypothetical protein [Polyangiaceae bacterium]
MPKKPKLPEVVKALPPPLEAVDEPSRAVELPLKGTRLFEVGPAGPATAAKEGVVMVTVEERVLLAKLTGNTLSSIAEPKENFVSIGRGPAVVDGMAYWVSSGRLLRARVASRSAPEVLATDARNGTRVQVVRYRGQLLVAYIGKIAGTDGLVARLWTEKSGNLLLSPDGSTANTVSIAESGERVWVVYLESRTGMSPLHARLVSGAGNKVELGPDVVVWVSGTAQPMTEVHLGNSPKGLFAFVPIERDSSTFGLARLALGDAPTTTTPLSWTLYANGLDPAPFAVAKVCGVNFLLTVLPVDDAPRSPEQLQLRSFDGSELGGAFTLANARVFSNVSFAENAGKVLFSYVADRETWALLADCATLAKLHQR